MCSQCRVRRNTASDGSQPIDFRLLAVEYGAHIGTRHTGANWLVLHAGIEPGRQQPQQHSGTLCRKMPYIATYTRQVIRCTAPKQDIHSLKQDLHNPHTRGMQVHTPELQGPRSAAGIGGLLVDAVESSGARMLVVANHGPGTFVRFQFVYLAVLGFG